jgi:hypothetical protein
MKTHFAYISFIIICTLSMGWLAASYSSKSTDKTDTIKLLEQEISYLKNSNNQPKLIFKTLQTAYPNVPEHKMRHYAFMIDDMSGQLNLSWSMIAATIWIESGFDPTLKSPKNAKGLMQLLENTALHIALKTGVKYQVDKTVWDDITNLFLGAKYLGEGFEKEKNYQETAYYYLAGPQWRKAIRNDKIRGYLEKYAANVLGEKEKLDNIYKEISGDIDDDQSLLLVAEKSN